MTSKLFPCSHATYSTLRSMVFPVICTFRREQMTFYVHPIHGVAYSAPTSIFFFDVHFAVLAVLLAENYSKKYRLIRQQRTVTSRIVGLGKCRRLLLAKIVTIRYYTRSLDYSNEFVRVFLHKRRLFLQPSVTDAKR